MLLTYDSRVVQAHHDKLHSRIQESHKQTSHALKQQDQKLKEIEDRLKHVNRLIDTGNNLTMKIAQQARITWLSKLGQDLKNMMYNIITINLATYSAVTEIGRKLSDHQLFVTNAPKERIFYLEDAIGRVFPITLQFITSWDVFNAVLEIQFRGIQGLKKVLKKEYILQNRATGRDIDSSKPWERLFLPGQRVDMSMILKELVDEENSISLGDTCPKCHAASNQPPGLEIKCSLCGLVYKRITELSTTGVEGQPLKMEHMKAPEAPDSGCTPTLGSQRPIAQPLAPSRLGKRKREGEPEDDIADFTRVRLMSKKRRKVDSGLTTPEKRKLAETELMEVDGTPKRAKVLESCHETVEWAGSKNSTNGAGNQNKAAKHDQNRGNGNSPAFTELQKKAFRYQAYQHPDSVFDFDFNKQTGAKAPAYYFYSRDGAPEGNKTDETKARKRSPPQTLGRPRKMSPRTATAEDARRAGIPLGYSLKKWDPREEPIILLGSVFDANSLGKWIYDWAVYHYGPATPMSEVAGDLWLLLIQLAGKVERADECIDKIRQEENRELVEDFLESGERLWVRFGKLLKICEDYMWKAAQREAGEERPRNMGRNSGCEFVDSIFGRDRELDKTEKLMSAIRLWSTRFDADCDEIFRNPAA
jgi:hypothetical protein